MCVTSFLQTPNKVLRSTRQPALTRNFGTRQRLKVWVKARFFQKLIHSEHIYGKQMPSGKRQSASYDRSNFGLNLLLESLFNFRTTFAAMKILQLSTALPEKVYETEQLLQLFPCPLPEGVKENIRNLGVAKRHLVDQPDSEGVLGENDLANLCREACRKAVKSAGISLKDVGCFIAGYDATPFLSPGLSQLLVPTVGVSPDTSLVNVQGTASTAFLKALELAQNYLAAHPENYVLVCISGVSSYWFRNQVRGLSSVTEISQINLIRSKARKQKELKKWVATMEFFLFGDGVASAIVAKDGKGISVKKIVEVTNIGRKDYLAGYARLSALDEPFKFGFHSHLDKGIPKLGTRYTGLALERLGKSSENAVRRAKKWAIHTGSAKILDSLAEHHGIQAEKLTESHEILKEYGNLSGASLPFILERIMSRSKFSVGDVIMMLGYGWGFSASSCILEHEPER
jgi:predicted naringenin-chalcone synthase